MITLTPIEMIVPTVAGVYAPSRLQPDRQMTRGEFLLRFADTGRAVPVSFAPDGKSDPQMMTAYGSGFDAWWIVSEVTR